MRIVLLETKAFDILFALWFHRTKVIRDLTRYKTHTTTVRKWLLSQHRRSGCTRPPGSRRVSIGGNGGCKSRVIAMTGLAASS
jgi:hypothetical protein